MNKKALLIIMVLVISCLSLASCNIGNVSSDDDSSSEQAGNYDEDFDAVMDKLDRMRVSANLVVTVNAVVWQEAGPEHVNECITSMLSAKEGGKITNGVYLYEAFSGNEFGARTGDKDIYNACWPTIKEYQKAHNELQELTDDVKDDIKELKKKYGDEHEDAIDALQDYYTKAAAYADMALNPSGNLNNYSSSHTDYESAMSELKTNAEFEK